MLTKQNPVDFMVNPIPELSGYVDALGKVNAKLSKLQREADILKTIIKASGLDEIQGSKYRAVISVRDSVRLDSKLVKGVLSPAEIAACSVASRSVSVSLYDL